MANGQIADIIAVEGEDIFTRPIYAGNAILKVKSSPKDAIKIVTVRTTAFDKAKVGSGAAGVEDVKAVDADSASLLLNTVSMCEIAQNVTKCCKWLIRIGTTTYLSEELTVSTRPDLSSAPRVVSGGRALKSQENFSQVLDPLADALGAGMYLSPASFGCDSVSRESGQGRDLYGAR